MHNFKPRHHLGQNFLTDEDVLKRIIQTADLKPSDIVLEVGPGTGVLTTELVKHAGRVIAVEKDPKLYENLRQQLFPSPLWGWGPVADRTGGGNQESPPPNLPHSGGGTTPHNLKLINQDILRFNLSENIKGPYKVVANIPYYLTSKLFRYFLEQKNPPKLMVLMVQKEVGERVVAGPGELSILGLSVQIYADAEIVAVEIPDQVGDGFGKKKIPLIIPKTSFWPVPEVDSVILKITTKDKYLEIKEKKLFFRIIKIAFAGKRKMIQNTLAHGLKFEKEKILALLNTANIDPNLRPQDLNIDDWVRLYSDVAKRVGTPTEASEQSL